MKKYLSILLALVFLCGSVPGMVMAEGSKLVIGTMPLTVGIPVQHALEQGYYAEEGLDVEVIIFSTGAPINEAYAAGQIDVGVSGLASVFSLALGTTRWIGEINTTGGLGIYVRPDSPILSVQGEVEGYPNIYGNAELCKGMTILGPLGTVSQYNAMKYMEKLGLTSEDYTQVHMDYGPAYQAFESGEGDAVGLNPPFTFQAEALGFVCAATFEDATGSSLMDGIFVSEKTATERRDDIVKFIRATYKACDDLQDEAVRYEISMRWFNENGKPYDEASLRSEMAVRDYINGDFMTAEGYMYGLGMKQIAEFYATDEKIEPQQVDYVVNSFDPSFINEALGIEFGVQK